MEQNHDKKESKLFYVSKVYKFPTQVTFLQTILSLTFYKRTGRGEQIALCLLHFLRRKKDIAYVLSQR